MSPDPEKVQGLARQAVRIAIQRGREAAVAEVVMEYFWPNVSADDYLPMRSAVFSQYAAEDAALGRPDEQPQGVSCPRCRYGTERHRVTCKRAGGERAQGDAIPLADQFTNELLAILENGIGDHGFHPDGTCRACRNLPGKLLGWATEIAVKVANEQRAMVLAEQQAERDADVRAMADLLQAAKRVGEYGLVMDEETVAELVAWLVRAAGDVRARYADRIDELNAREGGEEA